MIICQMLPTDFTCQCQRMSHSSGCFEVWCRILLLFVLDHLDPFLVSKVILSFIRRCLTRQTEGIKLNCANVVLSVR